MTDLHKIFEIDSAEMFRQYALEIFRRQSRELPVYREFLQALNCHPADVTSLEQIPFLPVEFFKSRTILLEGKQPQAVFTSSGTQGQTTSSHPVADLKLYEESFMSAFRKFYGDPEEYCLLALLPSYLEREGSSLVYMAEKLVVATRNPESGFYLHQYEALADKLKMLKAAKKKTILLGVTYALLDLAASFPVDFPELIIMETGGMKGRRKEMVREEVHKVLCQAFGIQDVHSEYGMTELLSQAYSKGQGIFATPPWMKVMIRDIHDPFLLLPPGRTGCINIIDLANANSCSFLATGDLGKCHTDETFEVSGRFDQAEIRGCNLMVE